MLKIRLQRHGRKKFAFYHIVAADARAPRDGKFVELLGRYNPNTNPATIDLDVDKAVMHLMNGAQPTDTAKAILSYKGALMKHHLQKGVAKGVLTQEQADAKYEAWSKEKEGKVNAKRDKLSATATTSLSARLEAERKVREARAAAIEAKRNPVAAAVEAEVAAEEIVAEDTATEEAPAAEEQNNESAE